MAAQRTRNQMTGHISAEDSDDPEIVLNEVGGPCPSLLPLGYKNCL